jgi:hypothetical protein
MKQNKYVRENHDIIVTFSDDITTAEIWDRQGNYARGNSKHHPDDSYVERFGQRLALARAYSRYYRKIEKQLVRSTK